MRPPQRTDLSDMIKRLIDEKKLSISEVARRAGLSRQALHAIMAGQQSPKAETLAKLGAALGVSISELMGESAMAPPQPPQPLRRPPSDEEVMRLIREAPRPTASIEPQIAAFLRSPFAMSMVPPPRPEEIDKLRATAEDWRGSPPGPQSLFFLVSFWRSRESD